MIKKINFSQSNKYFKYMKFMTDLTAIKFENIFATFTLLNFIFMSWFSHKFYSIQQIFFKNER